MSIKVKTGHADGELEEIALEFCQATSFQCSCEYIDNHFFGVIDIFSGKIYKYTLNCKLTREGWLEGDAKEYCSNCK